jgi:hypothetical protein
VDLVPQVILRLVLFSAFIATTFGGLTGCQGFDDVGHDISLLRGVNGVTTAAGGRSFLAGGPEYVFNVSLADGPQSAVFVNLLDAYGSVVSRSKSNDVELDVTWPHSGGHRELVIHTLKERAMPSEAYMAAIPEWPVGVAEMSATFNGVEGSFEVLAISGDANFNETVGNVAQANVHADQILVISERFSISWNATPPAIDLMHRMRAAAPSASKILIGPGLEGVANPFVEVQWIGKKGVVTTPSTPFIPTPEMQAAVDVWAMEPSPRTLTFSVDGNFLAQLSNTLCPSAGRPTEMGLWQFANRDGHRVRLAPGGC